MPRWRPQHASDTVVKSGEPSAPLCRGIARAKARHRGVRTERVRVYVRVGVRAYHGVPDGLTYAVGMNHHDA
eukprot:3168969-Prymnesium_polylepis.1